jgi:hypothetical protein
MSIITEESNIRNFKLSSGEELLAVLIRNRDEEDFILVEAPLLVKSELNSTKTSYMVSLQEYMPMSCDVNIPITKCNIISDGKCSLDAKQKYIESITDLNETFDDMPTNTIRH